MRFYAHLAGVWAVIDVCCRCQVLQILLLSLITCPFLTLGFSKFYPEGVHVPTALSAITHSYYAGALLVWWSTWEKAHSRIFQVCFIGPVSVAYDHECFLYSCPPHAP